MPGRVRFGDWASDKFDSRKLRRLHKARKGPGCREPRRKGMLGFVPIGMPLAQPTYVTMTPNNKAVQGYSGLPFPFTEMPRRNVLVYSVSGIYYSRKLSEIESIRR